MRDQRTNPEIITDAAGQADIVEETRDWFRVALGGGACAEVRSIRNGMLFQQIIVHDDRALITPYLFSATTGHSPCLDVDHSCPSFTASLREFDNLWKANAPAP